MQPVSKILYKYARTPCVQYPKHAAKMYGDTVVATVQAIV